MTRTELILAIPISGRNKRKVLKALYKFYGNRMNEKVISSVCTCFTHKIRTSRCMAYYNMMSQVLANHDKQGTSLCV